jgi:hypothetical protein
VPLIPEIARRLPSRPAAPAWHLRQRRDEPLARSGRLMTEDSMVPPPRRPDPRRQELAHYPFAVELQTRWGDMDALHHLNSVAVDPPGSRRRRCRARS